LALKTDSLLFYHPPHASLPPFNLRSPSSLCTNLGAAEKFSKTHLETPEAKKLIDGAKFFYLGGFFLTHGLESALVVAEAAKEKNVVSSLIRTFEADQKMSSRYKGIPSQNRCSARTGNDEAVLISGSQSTFSLYLSHPCLTSS